MCSRPFETRSRPRFLAATLATLPSMSLFPKAPFDLSVLPIYVARVPRGSIHSRQPLSLYLDHSHCPVLAPATLAALPSTRAIETRLLPSSLAATHRGFAFYVAFPKRSIPSLATCSMSLIPSAPFRVRRRHARHYPPSSDCTKATAWQAATPHAS
jgi:hypothetical protein